MSLSRAPVPASVRRATAAACLAAAGLIGAADALQAAEPVPTAIELGPRPYYLLQQLEEGPLREKLSACVDRPARRTDFSIGHRGAPLQFPEHSKESYLAAYAQGAGVLECDVTFTKDRALVCRHAQCDLHTTTNILATPLAAKCSEPFTPADPATGREASAKCCASDLTLAEFRTLSAKMDAADPQAITLEAYMDATAGWRTDLYSPGTVMSHQESVALFRRLGVKMTPELKAPEVVMPFDGEYRYEDYADQMLADYRAAGVDPADVLPQSFDLDIVRHWIANHPDFADQVVFLDAGPWRMGMDQAIARLPDLAAEGVKIVAPPLWVLVTQEDGRMAPSAYAKAAKAAGLKIITWTLERSGRLADGGGWYFQSVADLVDDDGAALTLLDVLAQEVGVIGVFSDWPATTSFYASCLVK
ncbi:MAG: glycerophosphodiester phosphodiesterase family protein [Marivibrio sp.]|uniref:glycerophosphodiester phosphodiesterase family protein n=1 Tax=Marivibrio sp. TaxID=2039719 RepID=UPI0032F098EB